jgi:hypothetical protein
MAADSSKVSSTAGRCCTRRSLLPDFFAENDEKTPSGILLTFVCLIAAIVLMAESVLHWLDEPHSVETAVVPTFGEAHALTVICQNSLGCGVEHVFEDLACGDSVAAALAGQGTPSASAVAFGGRASVFLCGSPMWRDGVRVTAARDAAGSLLQSSPVQFESAGRPTPLPFAALLGLGQGVERRSTPVVLGRTLDADLIDSVDTTYWSARGGGSGDTPCGMAAEALSAADVGGGLVGGVAAASVACWQLQLDFTATVSIDEGGLTFCY